MQILIVDDHTLFREGMRFLLDTFDESIELHEAESCESALEQVSASAYDLVLLDMKLPGASGLDALMALREACADTAIVVLSGEESPQLVRATIEAGAMGFIPKSSTRDVLINALKLILAGGVYLPMVALSGPSSSPRRPTDGDAALADQLSSRQMEVLRAVIKGKANKVIARELGISEHTVKSHLSSVFRALGVSNRTEAVFAAAKMGIRLA